MLLSSPVRQISKPAYLPYIHNLRGLAILIIVGLHCQLAFPWGGGDLPRAICSAILENGTILFVFIAGFLFQHLYQNYFDYGKYLKTKFKYIILPYICVSILPIIDKLFLDDSISIWLPSQLNDSSDIVKAGYMILTGKHFGPFWFIPMITMFYLVSPLLLFLDRPHFYYFVFPFLFLAGLFTFRFGYYSNILSSFIHFFPIYLLGMGTSRFKDKITAMSLYLVWILLMVYAGIGVMEVTEMVDQNKVKSFEEARQSYPLMINLGKLKVSILSIVLVRIFYALKADILFFKHLGNYSFGIFFIHLYFIIAIQKVAALFWPEITLDTLNLIVLVTVVSFFSVGFVWLVKTLFGENSRYLLGT